MEIFPDLDAELLAERGIPVDALGDAPVFLLPPDQLPTLGLRAGDLAGFRVTTAGMDITRVEEGDVAANVDVGSRLSAILAECGGDEPKQLDSVVWTARADDSDLFRTPVVAAGSLCVRGSRETRRNSASATRTGVRVPVARPRGAHHVDHRP